MNRLTKYHALGVAEHLFWLLRRRKWWGRVRYRRLAIAKEVGFLDDEVRRQRSEPWQK